MIEHSRRCAQAIRQTIEVQYTCKIDIKQLDLTAHQIGSLTYQSTVLIQQLTKLRNLILADCELFCLEGLPLLAELQELELSNNRIPDKQLSHVSRYNKLLRLNISYNCIQQIETVLLLKNIKKLKHIDCISNPFERVQNYEQTVFIEIPHLKVLNGVLREGQEIFQIPFYPLRDKLKQQKTANTQAASKYKTETPKQKQQTIEKQNLSTIKHRPLSRKQRDDFAIQIEQSDQIPKKRRIR